MNAKFQIPVQLYESCIAGYNAELILFFDILKLISLKCCETPKGRELHTVKAKEELAFMWRRYAFSNLIV